jgi:sRNA-binding protein
VNDRIGEGESQQRDRDKRCCGESAEETREYARRRVSRKNRGIYEEESRQREQEIGEEESAEGMRE